MGLTTQNFLDKLFENCALKKGLNTEKGYIAKILENKSFLVFQHTKVLNLIN